MVRIKKFTGWRIETSWKTEGYTLHVVLWKSRRKPEVPRLVLVDSDLSVLVKTSGRRSSLKVKRGEDKQQD